MKLPRKYVVLISTVGKIMQSSTVKSASVLNGLNRALDAHATRNIHVLVARNVGLDVMNADILERESTSIGVQL
jgi:hypothetical protein